MIPSHTYIRFAYLFYFNSPDAIKDFNHINYLYQHMSFKCYMYCEINRHHLKKDKL